MYSREELADVIKAYDVRGVVGDVFDENLVRDIGSALGCLLREEGEQTLAIGHDMRESSPRLVEALIEGVLPQGIDVVDLGLTSTDELYFASGSLHCAGVMFTASHNPARYNGMKMCRAGARPIGKDTGLDAMCTMLVEGIPPFSGQPGQRRELNVLTAYADHVKSLVDLSSMRPLVVAVDAANGMGGLTVPAVFEGLPIELKPLYFELDGTFPNHEANPLEPANLRDLQEFVQETGADIGLAFDGDADRCFVVDELGQPVSPSAICALIAERYLATRPGATIIHNLITSQSVPETIARNGGVALKTRVGHSFIKAAMAESGAVFGGEHSAHYYFTEFYNADSGILAALHVLAALGSQSKPLSELMASYQHYEASGEINSTVNDQQERVDAVLDAFKERIASVERLDGVSVKLQGTPAWFNIRASNTEPLLRLNVEARSRSEVEDLVSEILSIIRA
ncbi:phosphomannomutase/phosphoglucomutase [Corynebacterium poyangense]|uniref:Phosphomannomutase/phosphoglucomutase n=1 Tax=Corynebacterium poyangense TaxID=2684405 RepID=A0A7H0SMI5_9CORY|nr:phosphomannomutase/phosphoglucomutase [Corynebacterium poyangense]QNQ89760.1 phosphomannomutase/phosphoglucomutase [Corynebacterium poyangense]